jgi:hypothetical protein
MVRVSFHIQIRLGIPSWKDECCRSLESKSLTFSLAVLYEGEETSRGKGAADLDPPGLNSLWALQTVASGIRVGQHRRDGAEAVTRCHGGVPCPKNLGARSDLEQARRSSF